MVDQTETADKVITNAEETSTPTRDYEEKTLRYDDITFTVPSNSVYEIQLEYDGSYDGIPDISVAYDYSDSNNNVYQLHPRTISYSEGSCVIGFGNLRGSNATITTSMLVTLTTR